MTKKYIDVGRIIYHNIRNIAQFKTTGGHAHGSLITSICEKYEVDEFENYVIQNLMGNITRKHFYEFDAPSLEQPPSEPAMKRQRGHRQEAPEEVDEYEVPGSSGQILLQIEALINRGTQGTYDRLDHIIRQNGYIIQTNRAQTDFYNAYLASQNTYVRQ